jgi:alkylated DNA nucleotide flippase Atl1
LGVPRARKCSTICVVEVRGMGIPSHSIISSGWEMVCKVLGASTAARFAGALLAEAVERLAVLRVLARCSGGDSAADDMRIGEDRQSKLTLQSNASILESLSIPYFDQQWQQAELIGMSTRRRRAPISDF